MAWSKRRKLVRVLVLIVLGGLVVVAALPLWFPWILRPAAKHFGGSYAQYERIGYQRFRLTGFAFTNHSGRFEAKQVEAFLPTVWLWRRFFGPKSAPFVRVDAWSWKSGSAAKRKHAASAYDIFRKAKSKVGILDKWLPRAELTNGTVQSRGQTVKIRRAVWAVGTLSAQLQVPRFKKSFRLRLATRSVAPLKVELHLNAPELQFRSHFTIAAAGPGLALEGTAFWLSNRIALKASLPEHGFLPETASVRMDSFQIPAQRLKLVRYQDLTGSLNANWQTNGFKVHLTAKALPRSTNLPPIQIQAQASGTTNTAQIDVARVSTPWLNVRLSRHTRILFQPPFLAHPASLNVSANLAQQPWFAAKGKLTGQAVLRPGTTRFPRVSFSFTGSEIAVSNLTAKTLKVKGDVRWPQLDLTEANMALSDGSKFSLGGTFNLTKRTVQAGRLHFTGAFGQRFLPKPLSFHTATLTARFAGSLHALTNSATLQVEGLTIPRARPLRLDAKWQGLGMNLRQMQLALNAGDSALRMRGSARLAGVEKKLDVTALELSRSNRTELRLHRPFELTVRRNVRRNPASAFHPPNTPPHTSRQSPTPSSTGTNTLVSSNAWTLALHPVEWSGQGAGLRLAATATWPERGSFQIAAHGLNSGLFSDFVQGRMPNVTLNYFSFEGGWTNSPIAFHLDSVAQWRAKSNLTFEANAKLDGEAKGISMRRLSISSATQTVCHAQGMLPMILMPTATNGFLQIRREGSLRLQASTQTNSILWKEIADATGLLLREPQLNASLDGTWAQPRGHISLRAERIQFPRIKHRLPTLEKLDLAGDITPREARISRFHVLIQGQPVAFTAQVPIRKHFWSTLASKRRLPDWRKATARLKIENAKLAPFADLMPGILSPQGSARANITLKPGGSLNGTFTVTNAATLPLGNLGAVRHIHAAAVFAGQQVELTNFSADIGGQTITADGTMQLNAQTWSHRGLPPFVMHLHGTNVPLVRKPSLLLRADLALALTNSATAPPVVGGSVTLRDSLFLANLQSLIPEKASAPRQHPPYFSVTARPWDSWHLALRVHGTDFMRVQTPVFHGKISAALRLRGTLKSPLALGEIRISSGAVTFPFGSLTVNQGFISLTSDNPYHPRLLINAQAQRFGYNVKLEVSGTADHPIVQFSSTPPLSSEQIVLMLTTGQLPLGVGVSASTQQRAQGLALFFGKNLLSEFGLGLGGQNRLTFRSGQQISEAGRPTYEVDYQLSKRWSIVGQYDRFDQYNLNLKWNIYSK